MLKGLLTNYEQTSYFQMSFYYFNTNKKKNFLIKTQSKL